LASEGSSPNASLSDADRGDPDMGHEAGNQFRRWTGSGGRVVVDLAELNGHSLPLLVEDGYEFQPGAEDVEVLAQGGHAYVVGVLEFGDRPWVTSSRPASSA